MSEGDGGSAMDKQKIHRERHSGIYYYYFSIFYKCILLQAEKQKRKRLKN